MTLLAIDQTVWLLGAIFVAAVLYSSVGHGSASGYLAAMALLPVFWKARISLLLVAFVIGVVNSHMPGEYRHKVVLFRDRLTPDQRRG